MTPAEIEQLAREYATTRPAAAAPELRRAAMRERRRGGARDCHAAGADRRVEDTRRRRAAFDVGRVRVGQAGAGAARSGAGFAAGPAGARGEHVASLATRSRSLGLRVAEDGSDRPAVHALFVYNSNPGAVAPNHNAVRRGLERDDLFTVVHEQFFTDTTDYADYRFAGDNVSGAHRRAGRIRPLLCAAFKTGH